MSDGAVAKFTASFAYQPIVDVETRCVFAYEALVRGAANQSAHTVFASLEPARMHPFDRDARIHAIALAASLGLTSALSLNFLPQSLDSLPDAIESTLAAAQAAKLPAKKILLEVTEGEIINDALSFADRMNSYRAKGLRVAIDDFGAGYAGLNLLADFQPDVVKLDMQLVRGIDTRGPRQAIARAIIQACDDLGVEVIAEGIETNAEYRWFRRIGVRLFQGYFFGRPTFQCLGNPVFPESIGKSAAAG